MGRRTVTSILAILAVTIAGLAAAPAAYAVCVDDTNEPDDTVAEATLLDASALASAVTCAGDPDVYRVFIPADAQYSVTVTPVGLDHDVVLEWLDGGGNVLGTFDNGLSGDPEQHNSGFTLDTEWYYRVSGAFTEGPYTIELSGINMPAPFELNTIDVAATDDLNDLDPDSESNTMGAGWAFRELGDNSDPNANFLYKPSDGTFSDADTYSFGTGAGSDRAFGGVGGGTPGLHANLILMVRNDTGSTIASLDVAFTGEQWRLGLSGRPVADRLDGGFRLQDATSFTEVNTLDVATPNLESPTGALDGNAVGNRASISGTIGGLSIAPGDHIFLRWVDADILGAEDGLAVDDLSITPHVPPPDVDEDDDGVNDDVDLCPSTPKDAPVDPEGCAQSQLDDDDDGVFNNVDACPSSPPDDEVGPDGCAWNITVTIQRKGTVTSLEDSWITCPDDCTERLPSGEVVSLKAKPKRGYRLAKWLGDGCTGKVNPCVLTMDSDLAITAVFKKK